MVLIHKYLSKKRNKKLEKYRGLLSIIGNILSDEEFQELKKHRHHLFFNRYEHLMNVARFAYTLSSILKADITSCTLAGILHDFHFTQFKSYHHGILASENSKKFDIDEKVHHLIKSHMYPLGRKKVERYRGLDFWIIKLSDFTSMLYEIGYSILFLSFRGINKLKLEKNRLLIEGLTQNENVLRNTQAF